MRKLLSELLYKTLKENEDVWVITADLGFGVLDKIRQEFPERVVNVGASEQLMIGAAIGLAQSGKIPLCYSITPFLLFRPFEWLRLYVDHENIPVKLIGIGRGDDYGQGFSHDATGDTLALDMLPNIVQYIPDTLEDLSSNWNDFIFNNKPSYVNIRRTM